MKKRSALRVPIIILIIMIIALLYHQYDQYDSLRAALFMSSLNNLPEKKSIFLIETTGSIFTRGYRIGFHAENPEVKTWISNTPALKNAVYLPPTKTTRVIDLSDKCSIVDEPHNTDKYIIYNNRSCHTEVNILRQGNIASVIIRTFSN